MTGCSDLILTVVFEVNGGLTTRFMADEKNSSALQNDLAILPYARPLVMNKTHHLNER
jgi:hypothetical protein